MKKELLIITQKVNQQDPILGFFHEWIRQFALNVDKVTVICLEKGEYHLPQNVNVLSLGKERKPSRILYIKNLYKYMWQERSNYDAVFVHMNYEYLFFAGLFFRLFSKKSSLWYTHKQTSLGLKMAVVLTNIIFTASPESFRLKSKKVKVMGHGIDVDLFSPGEKTQHDVFNIVSVGRLSRVKDAETLIKAVEYLFKQGGKIVLTFYGDAVTSEDVLYVQLLEKYIHDNNLSNVVYFKGAIRHNELPRYLLQADLFVNMSHTGSLDKAVLEAMACAVPVLTCNEAFRDILSQQGLFFEKKNVTQLAERISFVIKMSNPKKLGVELREIVVERHNLKKLIPSIIKKLYETGR